jgi:molecular chaperone DnaK
VVLKNLNTAARADTPLEVTFELSSEGILSVRATDLNTGHVEAVRLEARAGLPQNEAERLSAEQAAYTEQQGVTDSKKAEESFRKLLERGEKLARLLQRSAQENPSPQAEAAVSTVMQLIDTGRLALEAGDSEQCALVTRNLTKLLTGRAA